MNTIRVAMSCAAAAALISFATPVTVLEASAQTGTEYTVQVTQMAYRPSTLRIHVGDTVTWDFSDASSAHSVTATQRGTTHDYFDSGTMTGGYYTHTFSQPGTYPYRCNVHTSMGGTIVVG
ncbi:cupredoxin domain-containing protein [Rhodococcus sp. NPDC003348]